MKFIGELLNSVEHFQSEVDRQRKDMYEVLAEFMINNVDIIEATCKEIKDINKKNTKNGVFDYPKDILTIATFFRERTECHIDGVYNLLFNDKILDEVEN